MSEEDKRKNPFWLKSPYTKGCLKSIEHKKKISNSLIGHKGWWKGKKFSEEHKRKIRLSIIGNENPTKSLKVRRKMSLSQIEFYKTDKGLNRRREISKTIKKLRKTQIFPKKDTSIEIKIQNFLKQLDIEFFTHQYMKIKHGYQCDILIPSMNLVIECDGNYWHKYPIGLEKDYIRTKELLKKGFKVLRLWESEINEMLIKQFKERLMEIK
jgi:very-short-patch-repair endonuclease